MRTTFLHMVIDVGLCHVIAPDGKPITVCCVYSNMPIWLWHEEPGDADQDVGYAYSFGRELSLDGVLQLDIAPFVVIVRRHADGLCCCVVAQNDVEEAIYHIKVVEYGRVIRDKPPRCFVGKVSKGSRSEFDMLMTRFGQTIRIETIPSEDTVLGKSHIIYREEGEKREGASEKAI